MSTGSEIGGDKQTVEGSLNAIHNRLRCYTNDQITILDDVASTIESFYKTEKHTHEKMQGSLQKTLEHAQGMSYLGSSIIGSSWLTAVKEFSEHYKQREASYPLLKQVVLENLKKIRMEKTDEHSKVILYDEEIIKEMVEIERRALKTKRAYDDACERLRQHLHPVKEKESGMKRLQSKILPKNESERLETAVVDTRNLYILYVNQMNYALKFYIEQFIVDLDKLLVCDLFVQLEQALDDLVYVEYQRLRDTLQCAIHIAVEDGDEQKRRVLPKTFQSFPLILSPDQSDQINTEDKYLPQLSTVYLAAGNDVRDADQQIQLALESSIVIAQQNKDSRMDVGKIRLKRMEMRKAMSLFIIETLETLLPNIKSAPTTSRISTRIIDSFKPIFSSSKSEVSTTSLSIETPTIASPIESDTSSSTFPCQAVVLYDFDASNEDEMSIRKDDKIFIESRPEHDGWLVARGRDRVGLVPETYVQLIAPVVVPLEQTPGKSTGLGNMINSSFGKKKKKQSNDKSAAISSPSATANEQEDDFSDDD